MILKFHGNPMFIRMAIVAAKQLKLSLVDQSRLLPHYVKESTDKAGVTLPSLSKETKTPKKRKT